MKLDNEEKANMQEKSRVLEIVNTCLSYTESCINNLYRGKVYIVYSGKKVWSYYKTRRGGNGYIERNSRMYYDDNDGSVCYSSYDIMEIKESELVGFNSYNMWYESFLGMRNEPVHLLDLILKYKKYVTDKELLEYIQRCEESVFRGNVPEYPIEKIAKEKGYDCATSYIRFLELEDERLQEEYEAAMEIERQENEKLRRKYERLNSIEPISVEYVKDNKIKKSLFGCELISLSEYEENLEKNKKSILEKEYTIFKKVLLSVEDFELVSSNLLEYCNVFERDFNQDSTVLACTLIESEANRKMVVYVNSVDCVKFVSEVGKIEISYSLKNNLQVIKQEQEIDTEGMLDKHDREIDYDFDAKMKQLNEYYRDLEAIENRMKLIPEGASNKLRIKLKNEIDNIIIEMGMIIRSDERIMKLYTEEK